MRARWKVLLGVWDLMMKVTKEWDTKATEKARAAKANASGKGMDNDDKKGDDDEIGHSW